MNDDIVERLRITLLDDAYCEPLHGKAAAEIERLRARLAEAERDAARYRWLRRANALPERRGNAYIELVSNDDASISECGHSEAELDAAIDAARERQP